MRYQPGDKVKLTQSLLSRLSKDTISQVRGIGIVLYHKIESSPYIQFNESSYYIRSGDLEPYYEVGQQLVFDFMNKQVI